jgi:tetratricopeptide (TPR) repeat protein
VDTHHVLLALLSCDFPCSDLLKERGWVFRNYLDWLLSTGDARLEFPDQLYPHTAHIPRKREVSMIKKLSNSNWKQELGAQYLDDALHLISYKEHERAQQSLANAATFAVHDEHFFHSAVHVCNKTKNWQLCLQYADEAVSQKINPHYFSFIKALCYIDLRNFPESVRLGKELLDQPGDLNIEVLCNIGFALSEMEAWQDAIGYFDRALELQADYAYALNNKGYCLYHLGDTATALELIHSSLTIDKGNSYAFRNLALIAKKEGDQELAAEMKRSAYLFGYKEEFGDDLERLLAM